MRDELELARRKLIGERARAKLTKTQSAPMLVKKSSVAESARQAKKRSKKKRAFDKIVDQINPPYKVYE